MDLVNQIIHAVKKQQEAIMVSMANGNCASFDSYQRLVGEYVGLQKVLGTIDQLLDEEKNVEK
jgi:hypothetical protein